MGISNYALDAFVSQDMSKLTRLSIDSLANEFPKADEWVAQFVMRRIFQSHVPDETAALAFVIMRRAHAAMQEWELASSAAAGNARSLATYFAVLRHLESCVGSTWQGLVFAQKALGVELFRKGDGSVAERLNWVYNVSRHFNPQDLPNGDLHRVWLSDEAIHTREHAVGFGELRDEVKSLARISDKVAGG